jgi:hypothetical protein
VNGTRIGISRIDFTAVDWRRHNMEDWDAQARLDG